MILFLFLQCGLLGFGSEPKGRPINRRIGPFVNRPPQPQQQQQPQSHSQQLQQQVKRYYQ
jgi:hypothetical protein